MAFEPLKLEIEMGIDMEMRDIVLQLMHEAVVS